MHLTNDAAVAFAGDNADDAVVESQHEAPLDDWDESLGGIVDKHDASIVEKAVAVSFQKLFGPLLSFFQAIGRMGFEKHFVRMMPKEYIIMSGFKRFKFVFVFVSGSS